MDSLDNRKKIILRAVILEYVAIPDPVGSEQIVQKYAVGAKSATVRNELAEMSDLGYLEQPHISAGRIPSDTGYRYFVDHLLTEKEPTSAEKSIVKEVTTGSELLKNILQETTKALSKMTHQLSAASTINNANLKPVNAIFTALGIRRGLLVVVFNNGHVENKVIESNFDLSLQDIERLNKLLPQWISGVTLKELCKIKLAPHSASEIMEKFSNLVALNFRQMAKKLTQGLLVIEGEEYMMSQPEIMRNSALLNEVLLAIENEQVLADILNSPSTASLTVTIGKENGTDTVFQNFTMVKHSFEIDGVEAGTVAILGPTRLNYETNIPLIQYASRAIGETMTRLTKQ